MKRQSPRDPHLLGFAQLRHHFNHDGGSQPPHTTNHTPESVPTMIMSSAPKESRCDSAPTIWIEKEQSSILSILVPSWDGFTCDVARLIMGPRYVRERLDHCHIKIQRIAGSVMNVAVVRIRPWRLAPERVEVMAAVSFPMGEGPICFARIHPTCSSPQSELLSLDESLLVEQYVRFMLKESACPK